MSGENPQSRDKHSNYDLYLTYWNSLSTDKDYQVVTLGEYLCASIIIFIKKSERIMVDNVLRVEAGGHTRSLSFRKIEDPNSRRDDVMVAVASTSWPKSAGYAALRMKNGEWILANSHPSGRGIYRVGPPTLCLSETDSAFLGSHLLRPGIRVAADNPMTHDEIRAIIDLVPTRVLFRTIPK